MKQSKSNEIKYKYKLSVIILILVNLSIIIINSNANKVEVRSHNNLNSLNSDSNSFQKNIFLSSIFEDYNINNYNEVNNEFNNKEFNFMYFKSKDMSKIGGNNYSNGKSNTYSNTSNRDIVGNSSIIDFNKIENSFVDISKSIKNTIIDYIILSNKSIISEKQTNLHENSNNINNIGSGNSINKAQLINSIKKILIKSIGELLPVNVNYKDINNYLSIAKKQESSYDKDFNSDNNNDGEYSSIPNIYNSFIQIKAASKTVFSNKNPDADMELPKPYSDGSEIPCNSSSDCKMKKLKWMKCTVQRIGVRTVYEMINMPLRIVGQIVYSLCACVHTPSGSNYQVKCTNTTGAPGLICTIPNMIYKSLYKISFTLWNSYTKLSGVCRNPITPVS